MRTRNNTLEASPQTPVCWQREAPSSCLRIELPSGETHLFPFQHFVTASLTQAENGAETLHVSFSSHDLEIEGRGLRDLLLGLQDFAVKWLRTMPDRYQTLPSATDGIVSHIKIAVAE